MQLLYSLLIFILMLVLIPCLSVVGIFGLPFYISYKIITLFTGSNGRTERNSYLDNVKEMREKMDDLYNDRVKIKRDD